MMQSLVGIISAIEMRMIEDKTSIRFKDKTLFKTPEALLIHEQNLLSADRLLEACQREYNMILSTPKTNYIPKEILQVFEKYNVFSPAMIDGIIKKLRSYGDRTLRADIGSDREKMLALVEQYFHCG